MNSYELQRCKNILTKDNHSNITRSQRTVKAELVATASKYFEFSEEDVYFEIEQVKGKSLLKLEIFID